MVKQIYLGKEILPGIVVHVSEDIKPHTLVALKDLAKFVSDMSDKELKEIELYAEYLKSKHKRKVGRPRKAKGEHHAGI